MPDIYRRYMLISACERDIITQMFPTLNEAQNKMREEMVEYGRIPQEAFYNDEYEGEEYGFDENSGWSNIKQNNDWIIIDTLTGETPQSNQKDVEEETAGVFKIHHREVLFDTFYVEAKDKEDALSVFHDLVSNGDIDFSTVEMIDAENTVAIPTQKELEHAYIYKVQGEQIWPRVK